MNFIKIPTKGMRDMLPKDMELREYVLNILKDTYQNYGFEMIQTPSVEHIENLTGKQGGDNEKLIFKILKRGEKLDLENSHFENDLVDSGLRYDLTVPLSRLIANNIGVLPRPFRALQIGNVWRADRPQKGRYREFMQCDLDIFGEKTNLAEIELINAVTDFLKKLQFNDFEIHINDRKILQSMVAFSGLPVEHTDNILISLDKLDKIFMEGVEKELLEQGYQKEAVLNYLKMFATKDQQNLKSFCKQFTVSESVINNLQEIIDTVKMNGCPIVFDPTLVRGMGYYTGPIFEIRASDLAISIGGGGRYDNMVSKYTSVEVPACGFSVGFERLVLLLEERGFIIPKNKEKIAYIINQNDSIETLYQIVNDLRKKGTIVKILHRSKNYNFQKEQLENSGYIIKEWK